jgi:thioesterase domain-containing protein
MTDTAALLSILRERDVRLWIEEDGLKCSAPAGVLDAGMRAALVGRKQEIIAFLRRAETLRSIPPAIVPIKPGGCRPPIFAVSGHGGDAFYLLALARQLDAEQPLLGVRPPGLDGSEPLRSVEALARYEVEQIRRYRPQGPYLIAGHCAGGTVAFEAAQQLTAAGQEVTLLALIGSPFPTMFRHAPQILHRLGRHAKGLASGSLAERQRYLIGRLKKRVRPPEGGETLAGVSQAVLAARRRVESATLAAIRTYRPRRYAGELDLFVSADTWHRSHQWRSVAGSVREHRLGDFEIDDLLLGPHVGLLAASLQARLGFARDLSGAP